MYQFSSALHVSGFLLAHFQRQAYNFGSDSSLLGTTLVIIQFHSKIHGPYNIKKVGTVTGLRADDPGILFLLQAGETFWILGNAKDGCEVHPAETFTLSKTGRDMTLTTYLHLMQG
jgi:hypothetical protein